MARAKKSGRGSPEAVAKRRAARALNQLFDRAGASTMDGRTLKRKQRLIKELKAGKRGQPLKAIEALQRIDELLKLGETLGSIRRLKPKVSAPPPATDETVALIAETQKLYGFDPKAWKILGVELGGEKTSKPAKAAKRASKRPTKKRARRAKA